MRKEILQVFKTVFIREVPGMPLPNISDDLILLESGMDSLGFAIFVTELEEILGFDPFTLASEAYYPQTFGELVKFYEENKP